MTLINYKYQSGTMRALSALALVLAAEPARGLISLPRAAPSSSPACSAPLTSTRPVHVKIDGAWYDVTEWAKSHPGGAYRLQWVNGFDVSGLFHTIHLFSKKKTAQPMILKKSTRGTP